MLALRSSVAAWLRRLSGGFAQSIVAATLAAATNMECATIAGGDISPLGNAAPSRLRDVIRWANRGRRKTVLVVEEAEVLLGEHRPLASVYPMRSAQWYSHRRWSCVGSTPASRTHSPSEPVLGCLTTILAATGDPSANFMFVFCTSQPDAIDSVSTFLTLDGTRRCWRTNLMVAWCRRSLTASIMW